MEFDLLSGRPLSATRHMSFNIRRSEERHESTLVYEIRKMIRFRRNRERLFGHHLFADPAWDMMLDLCLAAETHKPVSVSSLCLAAAVPSTTALRWIKMMEEHGMLNRQEDPHDKRRFFLALAFDTHQRLKALLRDRFNFTVDQSDYA